MKNSKIIYSIVVILIIVVISISIYYVTKDYKKEENKNENSDVITEFEYDIEEATVPLDMKEEVKIFINEKEYTLILENNNTAFDFLSITPLKIEMDDLNNNEKYVYLSSSLDVNTDYTGSIKKGDLMLYQGNCLVIFYKDFETNFHYTKIGHINNLDDLDSSSIEVEIK